MKNKKGLLVIAGVLVGFVSLGTCFFAFRTNHLLSLFEKKPSKYRSDNTFGWRRQKSCLDNWS